MKRYLIILFVLICGNCLALVCLPANGESVMDTPHREYDFHYHNNSDDYHFYGSDVWAVRFDFKAAYPNLDICEFSVNKAFIYLPQTGDSITVDLYSDADGILGSRITGTSTLAQNNYLVLVFPQVVQAEALWLRVRYPTNFSNRFVSASSGSGTHSYYWNTNAIEPYYQSFAAAGFGAELLFGVGGEFVLGSPDLELVQFDLEGELSPNQTVFPAFTIYNHSDQPVSDAVVNLNLYSPSAGYSFFDPIQIGGTIQPRSIFIYNSSSAGSEEHQITLPEYPLQLKLRANLNSPSLSDDPQFNNTRIIHRFSFAEPYPCHLVENFLSNTSLAAILGAQDQLDLQGLEQLNYFPNLNDSLSNVASQLRFNWYGFNSLPRTVLNGDCQINGYNTNYQSQYAFLADQVHAERTFVSSSNCEFNYLLISDQLNGEITLRNEQTILYNSPTEYNLVTSSKLFAGLFRKVDLAGKQRFVLQRWLLHAEPLGGTLLAGQDLSHSFNIPMNNLSLAELAQDYRVYYWLQLADGHRIIYSDWADFDNIVSVDEELPGAPRLLISSNPLRTGSEMKISMRGGHALDGIKVYNLRGQCVMNLADRQMEYILNASNFPASGVYLLRTGYTDRQGRKQKSVNKIIVIK